MIRIGILSDTHGFLHPRVSRFLEETDELWHAGDIGSPDILTKLKESHYVRPVYGNADGIKIRHGIPGNLIFDAEGVRVLMTHIGGYPGHYDRKAESLIKLHQPGLLVCGHSHILRVMYDPKYRMMMINPGAAGKYGIHRSITAVRLIIDGKDMKNLEVLDIGRNKR